MNVEKGEKKVAETIRDIEKQIKALEEKKKELEGKKFEVFSDKIAQMVIDEKDDDIKWGKVKELVDNFQPKNDTQAKKLGFKSHGKNARGDEMYFLIKKKGARTL